MKAGLCLKKITKAKRDDDVAHVVECLPGKREALNSNFSTTKNMKEIGKSRKRY
jgi:hypothetical protein